MHMWQCYDYPDTIFSRHQCPACGIWLQEGNIIRREEYEDSSDGNIVDSAGTIGRQQIKNHDR